MRRRWEDSAWWAEARQEATDLVARLDGLADRQAAAEAIVRAVAAASPTRYDSGWHAHTCTLCLACVHGFDAPPPADHATTCPWRLAVEWVEGQGS